MDVSGSVGPVQALVMAKAPEPGLTKTRLAATVGPIRAAELSAAALLDTLRACQAAFGAASCHLSLAGDLASAIDGERIHETIRGWTMRPQHGNTFGDRLAWAHREVPGPVLQVGMDTPQITPVILLETADLLREADAVLGPAVDGGWWVLALRDPRHAECLRDVPMSTSDTGRRTLERLRARGLSVVLAQELRDVDLAGDAEAVVAEAPETEFARQWTRVGGRA